MIATIRDIANHGSLLTLHLEHDDGHTAIVPAEARPTVNALLDAYPDDTPIGKRIDYELTDFGTMAGFTPAGEWLEV